VEIEAVEDGITWRTVPTKVTPSVNRLEGGHAMSLLLIILIVVLLVGVPGGWRYGGPYMGGGVGLIILILIILALTGRL
jgi:hypothetical protein